jgi:hypothetical protein
MTKTNAYLLNLIFSKPAATTSATGLFNNDNPTSPTTRSKVWYTILPTANWPSADPPPTQGDQINQAADQTNWGTPVADKNKLGCALHEGAYIRMVPDDKTWGENDTLELRFTAAFGRVATSNPGNDTTIASPFVLPNKFPCTTYTTDVDDPAFQDQFTPPGPDGSWIYYLGLMTQNQAGQIELGPAGRICLYRFVVGVTVVDDSTGTEYTFGHDPEMDVGG